MWRFNCKHPLPSHHVWCLWSIFFHPIMWSAFNYSRRSYDVFCGFALTLFTAAVISYWYMTILQIQGKFYLKIDHIGEGAKWRRTVGQEIYSPLLLAFTEQVKEKSWFWLVAIGSKCLGDQFCFLQDGNNWINSHVPTFSAIDPSYALPNNIAVITLQVMGKFLKNISWKLAH